MTLIPFPNDPARLAATNPIFNDNSFVRGDEQRLNNSEIWANFSELDSVLEIVQNTYLFRGLIKGSVEFDTASTMPIVKAGLYEVNGKMVQKLTDTSIALADTFFDNLRAIDSYVHYLILMNEDGDCKYLINGERLSIAGANQVVTDCTGTTTKTLTVGSVPGGDYIAVISGTGSFTGVFKSTRLSATTFSIVLNSDPGNVFTGMTVTLYFKTSTLHRSSGTGLSGITNTTITSFTPSLGENGETDTLASFSPSRNGFYCNLPGLTDWRVIGTMAGSVAASNVEPYQVISFLSGRNKNDNEVRAENVGALVTNALRWNGTPLTFGCDYIFYFNEATYGSWIAILRNGLGTARLQIYNSAAVANFSILFSDTLTGYQNNTFSNTSSTQRSNTSVSTSVGATSFSKSFKKGSSLKPLASAATLADARSKFDFTLTLG